MSQATLYQGPIIDAHHHVWEPQKHNYPWLSGETLVPHRYGDYTPVKRAYLPDDYRRDAVGVNIAASVYVEAEWDPADPIGETAYVSGLAGMSGLPNAIVAQAWLNRADVADVLAAQARFPLVRSVRHKPDGATTLAEALAGQRTLMSDDVWRRGYQRLADHGLHFDLQTPWWNLHEAAELARDFPATTLIVNHTGVPGDRSAETLGGWRAGMAAVAAQPNTVAKISGLCMPGRPWSLADNAEVVTDVIGLFGPDRVMFGSNFPVDGLCASFSEIFDGFRAIVAAASASDQRKMFFDTAMRVYRPHPLRTPFATVQAS
ncbi:MAG: amidohydrolase family protein [Phreatobacter sp.]